MHRRWKEVNGGLFIHEKADAVEVACCLAAQVF